MPDSREILVVEDDLAIRRLVKMVQDTGLVVEKFRAHSLVETSDPVYMLGFAQRGADALVRSGKISADAGEALKREASHRAETGKFFGHIAYVSLIATKP